MQKQLEQRLVELKREFDNGQKLLAEFEAKQANLKNSLLRISGAIQVIEELINEDNTDDKTKTPTSKNNKKQPVVAE